MEGDGIFSPVICCRPVCANKVQVGRAKESHAD